jgi:hypothetical protein
MAAEPESTSQVSGALQALGSRGLAAALRPLNALGGIADDIREMTADVARMRHSTDVLPQVAETLETIRTRVDRLDEEVLQMHAAVEGLKRDVDELLGHADRIPGARRHRRRRARQLDP